MVQKGYADLKQRERGHLERKEREGDSSLLEGKKVAKIVAKEKMKCGEVGHNRYIAGRILNADCPPGRGVVTRWED